MAASDMRSPPARPTLRDRLGLLSSSPSFPDLQDLVAIKAKPKPQTLRSGSAAAPIPAYASTAFTSASDLLRIARAIGDDSYDVIDEPDPPVTTKVPPNRVRKTLKEPKAPKEPKEKKAVKSKKVSKRVTQEVIVLSSDGATPISTRHVDPGVAETGTQCADVIGISCEEDASLQAMPWKKFKATTSPEHKETEAAEMASARPRAKIKSQKQKIRPETVSRHFSEEKEPQLKPESVNSEKLVAKVKRPRAATPEPTNLEPAVQRRVDWTPTKPDTVTSKSSPDTLDTQEAFASTHADDTGSDANDLFKNLRDKYGHKAADEGVVAVLNQSTTQVLGKRKVIEMISVKMPPKSTETNEDTSPAKLKAQKKKPRTITELATAAYAPKLTEEDGGRDDSLLEYFNVEDPEQNPSNGAVAKGKGKASKVTKSKKKTAPKKLLLLSPQSAMRQSITQDFVFGTASQLAREKSPTFLKDLHAAMKASTIAEEDDPFASPSTEDLSKSKVRGKGLWSVSARDEEGKLVDVENIDMINAPALPEDDAILDPWTQLPPDAAGAEPETADSSVIETDSKPVATSQSISPQPPVPNSHFFMTQKMTLHAAAAISPKPLDESFPLVSQLLEAEMPPPSNQQQTQEEARDSPNKVTAPAEKPSPKYETFTDVKLAKEISKFGFKAVKTRTGMIALLDQCWKRKSQASVAGASFSTSSVLASPKRKQADGATDTSTKSPPPAKKPRGKTKKTGDTDTVVAEASRKEVHTPTKKKRGRPRNDAAIAAYAASPMAPPPKRKVTLSTPKHRKAATRAEQMVGEFDVDSDTEASESSSEQLLSPGANADVTIGEDTEISLNLSPTAQQSTLFRYITKAVTSAPRTTDPENPSWHEKMLMYDPVILEDLTAWLNSGELTRLGHDDEVSPPDVKKWCESRSICCLWKGNWHGKERKRF